MKYFYVLLSTFLFTSCSSSSVLKIGTVGLVAMFGIMFLSFAAMFYLIARRKNKGEKSLVKFNYDVYMALEKLDTPQQKINMLNNLIKRIEDDPKYAKDTNWRDKVLVKTYMHLATIYYQTGEDMETLNVCTKIIELDPTDGMAYYNRGSLYSNIGMLEKALQDLNKTIEFLPDYASGYNNRGLVHEKMEHYENALSDFDEAIRLEDSPIAHYNRGNTHYEMEDYKSALADYQLALEKSESDQDKLIADIKASIEITEQKLISKTK